MSDGNDYDIEALRRRVDEDAGCPEFPALAEAERRAGRPEEARRICEAGLSLAPGRLAGRVSLGLALLELGESEPAKRELAGILDSALEPHLLAHESDLPPTASFDAPVVEEPITADDEHAPVAMRPKAASDFDQAVGDAELEQAFASAEPQVDDMFSANKMAEQVLMDHAILDGEEAEDLAMETSSTFSTETMAGLLERQGDPESAEAIRRSLDDEREPASAEASMLDATGAAAAMLPPSETGMVSGPDAPERARILSTLEGWLHNIQRGTA